MERYIHMSRQATIYAAIGGIALLAGSGIGYGAAKAATPSIAPDNTRQGGYQFINPLLSCDISDDTEYAGYGALQARLQSTVNDLIAQGDAKRISVYVRDMDSGKWTGVKPADRFAPASLMKVPLLIAYLQEDRTTAGTLNVSYPLDVSSDQNADENFKPSHPLALGGTYTVQQLLDAMIRYSDNNALSVLSDKVSTSAIDDVYSNFGVSPISNETSDSVSPEDYMRFFRILYNGTYLGRARSQQALQLLAQTDFTQGLLAGLPSGPTVSHKFGERSVSIEDASTGKITLQSRQLHDCGIVYYPRNPYGICIMTEGTDFTKLSAAIAQLSKITYQEVSGGVLEK
jgi:beta-lactamase class A